MKAEVPFMEPAHVERSSSKPLLVIVFLIVLVLVIATLGAYYFWTTKNNNGQLTNKQLISPTSLPQKSPTVTPVASAAASVTPKELEKSKLEVAVLNGSGVGGAARGISATLTKLGYTVKSVGNADGFAYTDITVKIKKSKEAYLPVLKKDLESDSSVTKITTSVEDDITADAEVIVGR